jgi:hypothetical protein
MSMVVISFQNFTYILLISIPYKAHGGSGDNGVGIATGYGLDDRGWEFESW